MKIHAIQTGTVAIKSRQVQARGHGARRQLNMFVDRRWTEPLPIYAFAVEHPEGVIVVDTGETARSTQPGYFPRWHPYYRYGLRLQVTPEQEIGPQLARLGIAPADVDRVVLTHLHTDHAGGLHTSPAPRSSSRARTLRSPRACAGACAAIRTTAGPPGSPRPSSICAHEAYGPFPQSLALTKAGDVTLVPLHGHTAGQLGVVVEDGDHSVLIGGDSAYREDLMLRGVIDGPSPDEAAARLTHERIRALAAQTPTVYLVAHDPQTAARLAERRVVTAVAP